MNCRHCHKELDVFADYCPHCGVAVKEPTEAENRKKPDIGGAIGGWAFLAVMTVVMLICLFEPTSSKSLTPETTVRIALLLFAALVHLAVAVLRTRQARVSPLIKRTANVFEKRKEPTRRSTRYYIKFMFPDLQHMEFRVERGVYEALEERDRIILKYKTVDPRSRRVYYGYERIDKLRCTSCGKYMKDRTEYCPWCGIVVNAPAEAGSVMKRTAYVYKKEMRGTRHSVTFMFTDGGKQKLVVDEAAYRALRLKTNVILRYKNPGKSFRPYEFCGFERSSQRHI